VEPTLPITGFELAPSRDEWNIGDQVLLRLRLTKAGETKTRYLLIELGSEKYAEQMVLSSTDIRKKKYTLVSPIVRTKISLYDEYGAMLEAAPAVGRFPQVLLLSGLYDGVNIMIPGPDGTAKGVDELTDAEADAATRGWMSLVAFSGSMNRKGVFRSMLEDVIRRPSLLALIFNRTISLGTATDQRATCEEAWVAPGMSGPGRPTLKLPLYMDIAGSRALDGEIECVDPVAPLSLCGGLVRAKGTRPDEPETTIEIELVSARRGTGGQGLVEIKKE
jgi:hypothetical protein